MARIIDLSDILSALADGDFLAVSDISANQDKKISALALKAYLLSGKTIGGSASGDITTNNGVQDLSGKKLIYPKINSSTSTAVTSEDLEKLHAVSVGATEINYLNGVSSNLQSQLNNKANATELVYLPKYYVYSVTATATTVSLSEAVIRAGLGLGSSRRISSNVMVQIYNTSSNPATIMGTQGISVTSSGYNLSSINLSSATIGNIYMFFVVCYDISVGI